MDLAAKRKLCIAGILLGGLMSAGPLIGLAGTVAGMMRAFRALSDQGVGDPSEVSAAIGTVLVPTAIGAIVFLPGVVLLIVSVARLARLNRQPPALPTGTGSEG